MIAILNAFSEVRSTDVPFLCALGMMAVAFPAIIVGKITYHCGVMDERRKHNKLDQQRFRDSLAAYAIQRKGQNLELMED